MSICASRRVTPGPGSGTGPRIRGVELWGPESENGHFEFGQWVQHSREGGSLEMCKQDGCRIILLMWIGIAATEPSDEYKAETIKDIKREEFFWASPAQDFTYTVLTWDWRMCGHNALYYILSRTPRDMREILVHCIKFGMSHFSSCAAAVLEKGSQSAGLASSSSSQCPQRVDGRPSLPYSLSNYLQRYNLSSSLTFVILQDRDHS